MPKISVLLTLALVAAWAYTSWYWYVCNIKGLCDTPQIQSSMKSEKIEKDNVVRYEDVTSKDAMIENESGTGVSTTQITGTGELYSSQKLSAGDVLIENPRPKQEEVKVENNEVEKQENSSGSTDEGNTDEKIDADITITVVDNKSDICTMPLIGPISYGGANNKSEVELLEAFLIARGADINIDGSYGEADLEEVKKFQLEYKKEVLDPWGIANPTGYVGKTTIQKINEIACQ